APVHAAAPSTEVGAEFGEARNVSARPVEACNQADLHGIGRICEHNWNCCGRQFCRQCRGRAAASCNERYLTADRIGGKCRQSIKLIVCPSIFDRNISAFGIAGLGHTLPEGGQAANIIDIPRCAAEKSDHRHCRLLRGYRERPHGGRATEQRDELAPFDAIAHSITSSARMNIDNGTSSPSAFAILMLRTRSYLIGACLERKSPPWRQLLAMNSVPGLTAWDRNCWG